MAETTRALAEFVLDTGIDDLSEDVRREGIRSFVNWVGCALGGARHAASKAALAACREVAGAAQATVIGHGPMLSYLDAAFMNCLSSSAHAFDDTHLATVTHPTGPVASALLALAERQRISGSDYLLALVLGIEVECRLSKMLVAPPAEGQVGWYITGVSGGIGAAAAAARLLGLDLQRTVWALGHAAQQASGFRQGHGTMSTAFVPGHAARCGLWSALLAAQGFSCSERIIEGAKGFAEVFALKPHLPAATDGLGRSWEILANAYKPYPCGIVIHPSIDGCLEIARRPGFDAESVNTVRLGVHPLCLTLCDRPAPPDGQTAQVSLQHWTAAALIRAAAGLAEAEDECVDDPRVLALRARILAAADAGVEPDGAVVQVEMRDGTVHERRIEHGIGSLHQPMSDADLDAKFSGQALRVLPEGRAAELNALCRCLPDLDDTAEIARRSYV